MPQVRKDIIPSDADDDVVPLQASLWCGLAVRVDVNLLHPAHHVFILVASGPPRVEAGVIVVSESVELREQLEQLLPGCQCLSRQRIATREGQLEPAAEVCVLPLCEVTTGSPTDFIRLGEAGNATVHQCIRTPLFCSRSSGGRNSVC